MNHTEIMKMTADISAAYLQNHTIPADDIPNVLKTVYQGLKSIEKNNDTETADPAVSPKYSVKPDYIVCLEDGKKLKMLKRHLRSMYGMSPEQYREKWGLAADYPMVAPNYAKKRSHLAKQMGLGNINQPQK